MWLFSDGLCVDVCVCVILGSGVWAEGDIMYARMNSRAYVRT